MNTVDKTQQQVEFELEVVVVPVADVDRAKAFYTGLGWRLDIDFAVGADFRVVQVTPPFSRASVIFGAGLPAGEPGSADSLILAVDDVEAARAALVAHGVEAGESFADPDGNVWTLQAIASGRVARPDVASRSALLLETSLHHGRYESETPPHHWWDWYAAYQIARESGDSPAEADAAADAYMKEVFGITPA